MKTNEIIIKLELELAKLNSTAYGRRTLLAAMPFLLASCATGKKSRYREGSNKGQKTKMTVKDEKKMTAEYLPKMLKDYPPYKSSYLDGYINHVGKHIAKANGLEGQPYNYNFRVVQSQTVNAFALPAGEVFVTGPLLAMAESEAELAGVIGHEIGHVKARHSAERIEAAKKEEGNSILYGLGGALAGGALGYGIGKATCGSRKKNKRKYQECVERAAKYGAAAGAAGGLLIQKYGFMANSREDEMEADRVGFRTSVQAGYNKDYVGKFYEKLNRMEKQAKKSQNGMLASLSDAMSTHPPSDARVKQMKELSRKQPPINGSTITTRSFGEAQSIVRRLMKV